MTGIERKRALACAVRAARAAGKLIRQNLRAAKRVNLTSQYDIKLELDVRSQKLIERILHADFPHVALLGEEGVSGDENAAERWVVDPIDGTVNFAYGVPHACVSIALQERSSKAGPSEFVTIVGVIYDPFCDELWTAIRGQPARLNGQTIRVSLRRRLAECIVAMGFSKSIASLKRTLPYFNRLVPRVRKVRMTGSAALDMAYVASGRFDAYLERGVRLWDIAAGGLIVECAGGEFWREPVDDAHTYRLVASNGLIRQKLFSFQRSFL
jgi:myo-inositol-1(or 4)-monophosphatase